MKWNDKTFRFTKHTTERLSEFGVSFEDGLKMFSDSIKEKQDKGLKNYRNKRYSGNRDIFYTRYNEYVFTVSNVLDNRTYKPIYLVLTATNQLINLKNYK